MYLWAPHVLNQYSQFSRLLQHVDPIRSGYNWTRCFTLKYEFQMMSFQINMNSGHTNIGQYSFPVRSVPSFYTYNQHRSLHMSFRTTDARKFTITIWISVILLGKFHVLYCLFFPKRIAQIIFLSVHIISKHIVSSN